MRGGLALTCLVVAVTAPGCGTSSEKAKPLAQKAAPTLTCSKPAVAGVVLSGSSLTGSSFSCANAAFGGAAPTGRALTCSKPVLADAVLTGSSLTGSRLSCSNAALSAATPAGRFECSSPTVADAVLTRTTLIASSLTCSNVVFPGLPGTMP